MRLFSQDVHEFRPVPAAFAIDLLSRLGTELAFEDLDAEVFELEGVQYFPSIEAANRERDCRSPDPSGRPAD